MDLKTKVEELMKRKEKEVVEDMRDSDINSDLSIAKYYADMKHIIDMCKEQMESYEDCLCGETIYLVEEGQKVVYSEGKEKTTINAKKLAIHLMADNRINEYFDISSVTGKALGNLIDGAELLAKFKEVTGIGKHSLKVSKMTKAELKEHKK